MSIPTSSRLGKSSPRAHNCRSAAVVTSSGTAAERAGTILELGRLAVTASHERVTRRARELLGIDGMEPGRKAPKSNRSRSQDLAGEAVAALRRHRERATVVSMDGRVFNRADGRALSPTTVRKR